MINWNYNAKEAEQEFELVPEGKHRVRIIEVEEKISKSGNDMLEITMNVSGYPGKYKYWLVFMQDNSKMTNQKLKQLSDSFGIREGNLNTSEWIGKTGAAKIKHELYDGETRAKIDRFVSADGLPAWVEKAGMGTAVKAAQAQGFNIDVEVDDDDLPFDM